LSAVPFTQDALDSWTGKGEFDQRQERGCGVGGGVDGGGGEWRLW
jgi:hypothetical protein